MALYALINPSDDYFFDAPDLEAAAMAVLLVGHGQYPAQEVDGKLNVPLFMFGGLEDWVIKHFGMTLEVFVSRNNVGERKHILADTLDTFRIGKDSPHGKKGHDKRRTSLNDLGRCAWAIAARLREQEKVRA